jgi:hypothetical protein
MPEDLRALYEERAERVAKLEALQRERDEWAAALSAVSDDRTTATERLALLESAASKLREEEVSVGVGARMDRQSFYSFALTGRTFL